MIPNRDFVEVQKRPPRDVPLWHVNYFVLKAIKTLQTHKKLLYLFLKGHQLGALPTIRVITRNNFYDLSIGQGKHPVTDHLLFSSSRNDPLKPQGVSHLTSSLAQNVIYTSFSLSVSEPLRMWGL